MATEAIEQDRFEGWVTARVKEGRSILGLYPPNPETQAEYDAWVKSQG